MNAASESTSTPMPPSPPQPMQGGKKERKRERGERNVNGCIHIYMGHTRVSSRQQSFLRAATLKENLPKTGSPDIRKSSGLSGNHTGLKIRVVDAGPGSCFEHSMVGCVH